MGEKMKFFNKIKFKIAFNKTLPFGFILPALSFLMFFFFLNSFGNGTPLDFKLLLSGILFLAAWVVLIMLRMNNNEYKEFVRQAQILGDLETVGTMIENLESTPVKGGKLKFNESLIFYSDSLSTKLIIPSKITTVYAESHFYKCVCYSVGINYMYENHISINMRSMEEAEKLCLLIKKTAAPHLLKENRHDD